MRRPPSLAEQLRLALRDSPDTRYRLALELNIPQSSLSRFVSGSGLTLDNASRLAARLGVRIIRPRRPCSRRRSARRPLPRK